METKTKGHSRIILCGASSVGKTTLADAWCAKHKEFNRINEVARDVMTRDGLTRDHLSASLKTPGKEVFLKLQKDILEEQNRREKQLESKPFISDRGPDPLIYFQQHVSSPGKMEEFSTSPAAQECFERYRQSLVVILGPLQQLPSDDGVRLVPANRQEQELFVKSLKELLNKYKIPFIYISETDHEQRMECLENAVYKQTLPFDSGTDRTVSQQLPPLCVSFPMHSFPSCKPQSSVTNASLSIPTIEVSTNNILLTNTPFVAGKSNRMIDRYGSAQFAMVSFHPHVTPTAVRTILNQGIWINGVEHQFLGCSSSGLKQRKCYLYRGDVASTEKILEECGSFSSIKSVSKQLKRISQLFSTAIPTGVLIDEDKLRIEDDIETEAGNFTDGCGLVSKDIAKNITIGAGLAVDSMTRLPSVFQIRYEGCKGIVVIDPSLPANSLVVRKSMNKFNPGSRPFQTVWLCDFSKPYSFGFLNKQFIILLSALGIKDEVFLEKQKEHFERIEQMTSNREMAIEMLGPKQPNLAISLVQCPSDIYRVEIQKELSCLQSKFIEKMEKLSILIPDSRNIFGVCDPLGVLRYGECFVRPTIRGEPQTVSGLVTVSKNPCYLLGDVRVLKAVCDNHTKGLEHLVDCIVFPVQGKRPHPSEIAGSDLDGDMYFVTWDPDLIVPRLVEPYEYPSTEAPVTKQPVTRSMRIDFISGQNRESRTMGRIDRYFNYWASKQGAGCDNCVALGKLFSRSVDASKTGDTVPISARLKPPDDTDDCSDAVWKEMEGRANAKKQEMVVQKLIIDEESPLVSEEFLWSLIQEESLSLSEFEVFRLVQRWCSAHDWSDEEVNRKLVEFSESINFGKLTTDQQIAVIDAGLPQAIVTNALNKSRLLSVDTLRYFSLHSSQHEWRRYFHCNSADFDWQFMLRALERNSESLIAFRLPDGVLIALHFLKQLKTGFSVLQDGSVIAYFVSTHFGYKQRHVLGQGYHLHLNEELLQIYRNNDKRQTFIWLRNEVEPKRVKGVPASSDTMFDRLSVDLSTFKHDIYRVDKHPKVNKEEFLEIEVFVKQESTDPTYFDVYVTDQSDVLFPEVAVDTEAIEEIPHDVSTFTNAVILSGEVSEAVLMQVAEGGDCQSFLLAIGKVIIEERALVIRKCLLCLLTNLRVRYGHRMIEEDATKCLQQILQRCVSVFKSPQESLSLIGNLCWLNIPLSLLKNVCSEAMSQLEMTEFSTYQRVISQWKMWCIIPLSVAYQFARSLNTLCQSLVEAVIKPSARTAPSLEQLNLYQDTQAKGDTSQLNHYLVHFLHRILLYFFEDVHSQRNSPELNNRLVMLKASLPSDTREHTRINFHGKRNICSSEFMIGTHVLITPMKTDQSASIPVALGHITRITKTPPDILLEVNNPVPKCLVESARLSQGHWELRLIANVTLFNRSLSALAKLANSKEQPATGILPLLVHPDSFPYQGQIKIRQIPAVIHSDLALDSRFNERQQQAINAALTQRLTLIHGPPGTGKTHVACGIIEQIVQLPMKVLVAAETNMAVDNITRRLSENNISVVRVGNLLQMSPDIRHVSLDQQIDRKRLEMGKDKSRRPFPEAKLARDILQHASVIAVTCASAGDPLLESLEFPFVIIDEATLVIEPFSLIPIVLKSQQLVLIGDPQQLSPHMQGVKQGSELDDLSVTLFHRFQYLLPSVFLEEQHRMHPSLAEFPSVNFYDGRLKSAPCLKERGPFCVSWIRHDNPSVFIDVSDGAERRFGTSYCNAAEADVVVRVIKSLINNQVSPLDVTVLTPYIGQVKCVKEKLAVLNDKVKVSTVDKFQGQESEVIVFSTVRCNPHNSLGFIDDQHRVNVLLTRAKSCLIGIGSKGSLQAGSELWTKWLKETDILSVDDFHRKTTDIKPVSRPEYATARGKQTATPSRGRAATPRGRAAPSGGERRQHSSRSRERRDISSRHSSDYKKHTSQY